MRRFRSHKVVEAEEIVNVYAHAEGGWLVGLKGGRTYRGEESLFARGLAKAGDFLVRYPGDGYVSWSPRQAFLDGYREVGDRMAFGDALELLKNGYRIAREGWNGKGMWLALSGPLGGRTIPAESFWAPHNAQHALDQGGSANVLPCITMKTADGSILMGWLASQSDMLSDDWVVVP